MVARPTIGGPANGTSSASGTSFFNAPSVPNPAATGAAITGSDTTAVVTGTKATSTSANNSLDSNTPAAWNASTKFFVGGSTPTDNTKSADHGSDAPQPSDTVEMTVSDYQKSVMHQADLAGSAYDQAKAAGQDVVSWVNGNPNNVAAKAYIDWTSTQEQMYQAGFYGSQKPNLGAYSLADKSAIAASFDGFFDSTQNGPDAGTSYSEWVSQQAQGGMMTDPAKSSIGDSKATFNAANTAPQYDTSTAHSLGDTAAQSELGQALDPSQVAPLQAGLDANSQADAASGTGGSVAQGAGVNTATGDDPTAYARQWVVQNNLPSYTQHQVESYMNVFANMLLGGQDARANTSVGDVAVGVQ